MNDFSRFIEDSMCIYAIYLNFAKAFHTVPLKRLINKLDTYGMRGNLLQLIKAFLSNRVQHLRVNSACS